jgi:hypothetical protein
MAPGSIVSAHNVLSTVPAAERYLSTCYMPAAGVQPSQVTFRVFVRGSAVYEGPGSPATPTCVRLPFPQQLATGDEVRVQALYGGNVLAEDVYRHEDVGVFAQAAQTMQTAASSFDWNKLLLLALAALAVWFFLLREKEDDRKSDFDLRRLYR